MERIIRSCTYCGLTYGSLVIFNDGRQNILQEQMDHFFPNSKGGPREDNIVSCCQLCNSLKRAKTFSNIAEVKKYIESTLVKMVRSVHHMSPMIEELQVEEKISNYHMPKLRTNEANVHAYSKILFHGLPSSSIPSKKGSCIGGIGHAFIREGKGLAICCDCGQTSE